MNEKYEPFHCGEKVSKKIKLYSSKYFFLAYFFLAFHSIIFILPFISGWLSILYISFFLVSLILIWGMVSK